MSATDTLADAVQALAATLRTVADDPADQIRLLAALAVAQPAEAASGDTLGAAIAAAEAATAALCRRAAVVALARAAADSAPPSYDAAVALRELVCGLIEAEIVAAGDMGDDASGTALRALKTAVAEDLTARAANLARLQPVKVAASLPALVMAYRLYGDLGRADEVAAYAGADDPNFLPGEFRVLGR